MSSDAWMRSAFFVAVGHILGYAVTAGGTRVQTQIGGIVGGMLAAAVYMKAVRDE